MLTDLHMHVVPDYDDGADSLEMSLEMLRQATLQGVTAVFCTSHNAYSRGMINLYNESFEALREAAGEAFPSLTLYRGTEIFCTADSIDRHLQLLESGHILTLADSRFVLTEFDPRVEPDEAKAVVKALQQANYYPVLAHAERYPRLFADDTIKQLTDSGVYVQVNLYSLQEEQNDVIRNAARYLIKNRLAHFIGSDAHKTTHRSPKYEKGKEYLIENCSKEYYEELCCKNASRLILR